MSDLDNIQQPIEIEQQNSNQEEFKSEEEEKYILGVKEFRKRVLEDLTSDSEERRKKRLECPKRKKIMKHNSELSKIINSLKMKGIEVELNDK
jgi:methylmalonyl-CoA mutase N-terminal domain/subunit